MKFKYWADYLIKRKRFAGGFHIDEYEKNSRKRILRDLIVYKNLKHRLSINDIGEDYVEACQSYVNSLGKQLGHIFHNRHETKRQHDIEYKKLIQNL